MLWSDDPCDEDMIAFRKLTPAERIRRTWNVWAFWRVRWFPNAGWRVKT